MIITNVWLGVPFMMVIILGGLQSISSELLRGRRDRRREQPPVVPGASPCRCCGPCSCPPIILGTFRTFNNIIVPFFINQNELETSDILVTALFRQAFQYNRYGLRGGLRLRHLR